MAENGADIFACADKCTSGFEDYCKALGEEHHVQVSPLYFDMSDSSETKEAIGKINARSGGIQGLVNLAGKTRETCFGEMETDELGEIMRDEFLSTVIFTQGIAKHMMQKGRGSIAFVSGIAALDGGERLTAHAAAVAALLGAMRSIAIELGRGGIRVNSVAAGTVRGLWEDPLSSVRIQEAAGKTDLKRIGEPGEVAKVLLFLMSDMSSHITGQTIRVDGGVR